MIDGDEREGRKDAIQFALYVLTISSPELADPLEFHYWISMTEPAELPHWRFHIVKLPIRREVFMGAAAMNMDFGA